MPLKTVCSRYEVITDSQVFVGVRCQRLLTNKQREETESKDKQVLLTTLEVAPPRYRRRNPPLATVPCRQLVHWLPSDLVAYCRVLARDRHSLPSQRPFPAAAIRMLSLKVVSTRQRTQFTVALPSRFRDFCDRRLPLANDRYYERGPLEFLI